MRVRVWLLGLVLIGGTVENGVEANWSHWSGPTGNSVAPAANPPVRWSPTENVRWKGPIPGLGSRSPVVWDDRIFVVIAVPVDPAARPNQQTRLEFKLLCFRRGEGELLWQQTANTATPHPETHATNSYASASPCTDGHYVYAHFGSRGLYCYTIAGDPVRERKDFGRMITRHGFGEGSSPTITDDKILVPWDHEGDSALHALDRKSGETIWRVTRDEPIVCTFTKARPGYFRASMRQPESRTTRRSDCRAFAGRTPHRWPLEAGCI